MLIIDLLLHDTLQQINQKVIRKTHYRFASDQSPYQAADVAEVGVLL